MAAMMALSAGSAFADHNPNHNPGGGTLPAGCTFTGGGGTTICVTKTVDQTTEFEITDQTTEFVERPTTGPCTVGNSGRVGTAEGVATDEVLVTTETTTTEVFEGRGNTGTLLSTTSNTVETGREVVDTQVTRDVVDTTFTQTGKCKNVSGPQPQASGYETSP